MQQVVKKICFRVASTIISKKGFKKKNIKSIRLHFFLTACSEAPMYLFSSSGPLTEINRSEQAAAAAPTICVLPQPGGPYSSRFDRILKGACENTFGNLDGISIICYKNDHKTPTMFYWKQVPTQYERHIQKTCIQFLEHNMHNSCNFMTFSRTINIFLSSIY